MLKALVLLAGAALAVAGLSLAAPQQDTYALTASLRARAEVPKPSGVPSGAVGLITGKAVELESDRARLTWRLTFRKLSGRAIAAHVHAGRPGKAGNVLVPLCGPCRSGQRGRATITHAQLRAIRRGLDVRERAHGTQRGRRGPRSAQGVEDGIERRPGRRHPSPSPEPPPRPTRSAALRHVTRRSRGRSPGARARAGSAARGGRGRREDREGGGEESLPAAAEAARERLLGLFGGTHYGGV